MCSNNITYLFFSPQPQSTNLPTNTQASALQTNQHPQPLLQLMPHTPQPQQPLSPGASVISPEAFYYWNQPYYATGQYQQYPNNGYCPPNGPYHQWPMTNINFIPNVSLWV